MLPTGSQAPSSWLGFGLKQVWQSRAVSPGASSTALQCQLIVVLHWITIICSGLLWVPFLKLVWSNLPLTLNNHWTDASRKLFTLTLMPPFWVVLGINPLLTMSVLRGMDFFPCMHYLKIIDIEFHVPFHSSVISANLLRQLQVRLLWENILF